MRLYDDKLTGSTVDCKFCVSNATTQVYDFEDDEWILICRLHAMNLLRECGPIPEDFPTVIYRRETSGVAWEYVEDYIVSENLSVSKSE